MRFVCFSINFQTACLDIREAAVLTFQQQREVLEHLKGSDKSLEGMVLCTCNRTEIYLNCPAGLDADSTVQKALVKVCPKALEIWAKYRQIFEQAEAVEHLFSVVCGLESQMVGENQIVRQLKDAYTLSIECGASRFFFHKLMHCAFRASKAVRQATQINCGAVSLSMAAVETARNKINLAGANVLIVGAGENAALVAKYLVKEDIAQLTIANRTIESAKELAGKFKGAKAAALACLGEQLSQADVAIFSTGSPHAVLTAEDAGYYLSQRLKPILIIDLAVPRDVEAEVGRLDNIELVNIEQLNEQVEKNRSRRNEWIEPAQKIIGQHAGRFMKWLDSLDTAAVIAELTQVIMNEADLYAKRYRRYFDADDHQRLEKFAQGLAKKILHHPIEYLKDSDGKTLEVDKAQAAELVTKLFLKPKGRRRGR